MKVLKVRNVHEALPRALQLLEQEGVRRDSRNGSVLVMKEPVTTVYEKPCERVMFWITRDANPFFHLYESLWMLAGLNTIAGPARYAKNMLNYSDDGVTQHAAYGHRWRHMRRNGEGVLPLQGDGFDQLKIIAERLEKNPDDRRCVLQMWDADRDLGKEGKDFPCNLTATFQRGYDGELNVTVFCRSNDIIWGCYGANAVHFSMLQEYMANWIGCPVGTLTQVSVNWHAYLDTFEAVKLLRPDKYGFVHEPYSRREVIKYPLIGPIDQVDDNIARLLQDVDDGFVDPKAPDDAFMSVAYCMLFAHHVWRTTEGEPRYTLALDVLDTELANNDWITAGREWIERRYRNWQERQAHASAV